MQIIEEHECITAEPLYAAFDHEKVLVILSGYTLQNLPLTFHEQAQLRAAMCQDKGHHMMLYVHSHMIQTEVHSV